MQKAHFDFFIILPCLNSRRVTNRSEASSSVSKHRAKFSRPSGTSTASLDSGTYPQSSGFLHNTLNYFNQLKHTKVPPTLKRSDLCVSCGARGLRSGRGLWIPLDILLLAYECQSSQFRSLCLSDSFRPVVLSLRTLR